MAGVDQWFDAIVRRGDKESDEQYRKRMLKEIKARLIDSYRSGKKSLAA
jgi:hypothetical protein